MMLTLRAIAAATALVASTAQAVPSFVNGLALDGNLLDLSGGTTVNDGRVGFFSDIYYDPNRKEWWGLSDRGPGGGTLDYDTRVQRFTLTVEIERPGGRNPRPLVFDRVGWEPAI